MVTIFRTKIREKRKSLKALNTIRGTRYAGLYIGPAFLIFLAFTIIPTLFVVFISLFHWDLFKPSLSVFVGLKNYVTLVKSSMFWQSLLVAAEFIIGTVPTTVVLAISIAALLMETFPLRSLMRTGVFSPYITPLVATSIIWIWMLNPQFGLINTVLHVFHLPALGWLESPRWALLGVILFTLWHNLGFAVIIFMAGFTGISTELGEAALVDGASAVQRFLRVTWHLLSPTTFFVLVITTIGSLQAFTQFFTMTHGGPLASTTPTSYLVYEMGFLFFHEGFASAIAVVLFILVAGLTILQWRISDRHIYYQ